MTRGPESGWAAGPRASPLPVHLPGVGEGGGVARHSEFGRARPTVRGTWPIGWRPGSARRAWRGVRRRSRTRRRPGGACRGRGRRQTFRAPGRARTPAPAGLAKGNAHRESMRSGPPGGDSFPRALAGGRLQGPGAHAAGFPARRPNDRALSRHDDAAGGCPGPKRRRLRGGRVGEAGAATTPRSGSFGHGTAGGRRWFARGHQVTLHLRRAGGPSIGHDKVERGGGLAEGGRDRRAGRTGGCYQSE